MKKIAVCLVCYNQEHFIAQAIKSVLDQIISCPCLLYIGEDCSTDGTLQICESFAEKNDSIILLKNKHNIGLVANTINVFKRIIQDGCDYVAMLDGDDYWIDKYKLQRQFDFLEENSDYGLTYTDMYMLFGKKLSEIKSPVWAGYKSLKEAKSCPLPNNTAFFRCNLFNHIHLDDFLNNGFQSCDYAMYVIFSHYTKFKSFPVITAVCRRGHSSVSCPKDMEKRLHYIDNDIAHFTYLGKLFPDEIPFTDVNAKNHKDYMTFNIACKYGKFALAKLMLQNQYVTNYQRDYLYKFKILCCHNRLSFGIWYSCHKVMDFLKRK